MIQDSLNVLYSVCFVCFNSYEYLFILKSQICHQTNMTVIFVFLCADCEVCDSEYNGHCTKHRPLIEFEDSEASITC